MPQGEGHRPVPSEGWAQSQGKVTEQHTLPSSATPSAPGRPGVCARLLHSADKTHGRETKDSTAAGLEVLYIYCILNKNTFKERIFSACTRHGLSTAVCFDTGTYFSSQLTWRVQEGASFASQYRKATPPRGLHRAGDPSPDLGPSVTVQRKLGETSGGLQHKDLAPGQSPASGGLC